MTELLGTLSRGTTRCSVNCRSWYPECIDGALGAKQFDGARDARHRELRLVMNGVPGAELIDRADETDGTDDVLSDKLVDGTKYAECK